MALWLMRAGRRGEHEGQFFSTGRIYLTWGDTFRDTDPTSVSDYDDVRELVNRLMPEDRRRKQGHTAGQFWAFLLGMKPGDWLVTPRKTKAAIAIGEVAGPVGFDDRATDPYQVFRPVKWLNLDVPRSVFSQDLLHSFGAFMTVCEVKRNDAERRVRALAQRGWKRDSTEPASPPQPGSQPVSDVEREDLLDLEQRGRDLIASRLQRHFAGHGLARLIEAILNAQGFVTYRSPEGPDKGVDVLAAPGLLGFGSPRVCVQVKSGDEPVDRATLDQLIGAMQNHKADQGLLVSWGGFKSTVDREMASQFFRVRLWDSEDVIENLLANYERVPEDLRAELSLKRIWTLAEPTDDD